MERIPTTGSFLPLQHVVDEPIVGFNVVMPEQTLKIEHIHVPVKDSLRSILVNWVTRTAQLSSLAAEATHVAQF